MKKISNKIKEIYIGYKRYFFMLMILILFVYIVGSENGLIDLYKTYSNIISIEDEIDNLIRENVRLKKEIKNYDTNLFYIETLAREKLGLVKEGEIIYRDVDGKKRY
ncbi:MAG: septum formation initiator family protein [Candidatus Hydrogenedentota bacterium]